MDFLTSTILSGLLYDGFKSGALLTIDLLKEKLTGWIFDEEPLHELTHKLESMHLDDLSEHAIERKINEASEIQSYLQKIIPEKNQSSVTQNHYGSGDNVVNKTVYNK